jgi:hypothetical protein
MKSSIELLPKKARTTLAHFYGTEAHDALRQLIDIERLELAKDHVDQTDILQVRFLSGQTYSLKKLIKTLEEIYKRSDKEKR